MEFHTAVLLVWDLRPCSLFSIVEKKKKKKKKRKKNLIYGGLYLGLNKIHFICNNTLTTEQLGHAKAKLYKDFIFLTPLVLL